MDCDTPVLLQVAAASLHVLQLKCGYKSEGEHANGSPYVLQNMVGQSTVATEGVSCLRENATTWRDSTVGLKFVVHLREHLHHHVVGAVNPTLLE